MVVQATLQPHQPKLLADSPIIPRIKNGTTYEVEVLLFSDEARTQRVGKHDQGVLFNMPADTVRAFGVELLGESASSNAEPEITMNSKAWHVGNDASDAQQHLTEYVLAGQTVEDWRELLTRQIVADPKAKIELSRLVDLVRKGFGSDCKQFHWKVIRQDRSEVFYSWHHNGCHGYPAQAQLSRIIRVPQGICSWAYASKEVPPPEGTQEQIGAELAKLPCG